MRSSPGFLSFLSQRHASSTKAVSCLGWDCVVGFTHQLSIWISLSDDHVSSQCLWILQIPRIGRHVSLQIALKILLFHFSWQLFSVLFICLVAYLDLLCWTVLTGPWLFLAASSCVWFEVMRSTGNVALIPLSLGEKEVCYNCYSYRTFIWFGCHKKDLWCSEFNLRACVLFAVVWGYYVGISIGYLYALSYVNVCTYCALCVCVCAYYVHVLYIIPPLPISHSKTS